MPIRTAPSLLTTCAYCAGNQLASNDDACGFQSAITFTAPDDGDIKLIMTAFSSFGQCHISTCGGLLDDVYPLVLGPMEEEMETETTETELEDSDRRQLQEEGCPNTNTQYGTSSAPTTVGALTTLSSCMYGGEVCQIPPLAPPPPAHHTWPSVRPPSRLAVPPRHRLGGGLRVHGRNLRGHRL